MPELPEVETIRRDLEKVLIGKKIVDVTLSKTKVIRTHPKQLKKTLLNNHIIRVERIGKLLMFALASGEYLLVHLKMTGQLFYAFGPHVSARGGHSLSKEMDNTLPNKYTQAVFTFACHPKPGGRRMDDGGRLFLNDRRLFAYLQLVDEKQKLAIMETYGIEPLTPHFTFDRFSKIFQGRKTNLKAVLLNQTLIAGIGNIYADEICFASGVKPTRIAGRLTKAEIASLWHATQDLIKRAIEARGTTFNSYVDGEGRQGSFLQQLCVYGKGGKPCLRCGILLKKIRLAGRGTVFCLKCQE
ncbi:MAG: bifunctional DNA-formamidopyrimidine glycosylase/DNA-(apurinic or apyrimidinic site) lyase [Patescibacteria group bacterium]